MEKKHFIKTFIPFLTLFSLTNCGVNQLCEMIQFYDKLKTAAECVTYDNYGCWCGPGGSGKPVDETDICCQKHDSCYDVVLQIKRCNPYFQQYNWNNGTCLDEYGSCLYQTCECDRKIAACVSSSEYEWRYWGHRFWPGNCK